MATIKLTMLLITIFTVVAEGIATALIANQKNNRDTLTNFLIFLGNFIKSRFLLVGYFTAVLSLFQPLAIFELPDTWWKFPVAFLLVDLLAYWNHRLCHTTKLLWSYHSVHHSSQEYNFSTAFRFPWFDFVDVLFFAPAVIMGFDVTLVVLCKYINFQYQFWLHTERVQKLGVLELFLNTPSHHRAHHGINSQYIDKNFACVFIIWDRLFGSFAAEKEKVIYGTIEPLESKNPLTINLIGPIKLFKETLTAPSAWAAVSNLFAKPGVPVGDIKFVSQFRDVAESHRRAS